MTSTFFDKYQSVIVGTGNVLDDEEFKKAKTPTQEMLICISSRINELMKEANVKLSDTGNLVAIPHEENGDIESSAEGKTKTVLKIFLNEYYNDTIEETLVHTLKLCKTAPNVILSYSPASKIQNDKFIWAENDVKAKANFKALWSRLREEKKAGKIEQLGIADMDLDTILDIFEDKHYDFTILQINIATCCMPPPCLVNFCKENEIQLLTHSDPQVLLPSCHLDEINLSEFKVKWIVRYLETLVCRGILTKKGFIVNFQRK